MSISMLCRSKNSSNQTMKRHSKLTLAEYITMSMSIVVAIFSVYGPIISKKRKMQ